MQPNQIVDETLKKVARGTTIVFAGIIAGMILAFIARVIVVRYITQSEYGIFSLATTLTSIFALIACLGLQQGVTRYIAYFRGRDELSKIKGIIFSSLRLSLIAGILLSAVLFFLSDIFATKVFNSPELSTPIKILSIQIPFLVFINILVAIFRGFDRADIKVYFQDILYSALFLILMSGVILLGLSFSGVLYTSVAQTVITCIAFAVYAIKKPPLSLKGEENTSPIGRELLLFSLPLLGISMLGMVIQWTDTIMLGYFKTDEEVGLYNGALPLARLIPITLTSLAFIYVPVISQLYAKGLMDEIKRSYQVLTKWIFALSLPLALILLLFPEAVLNFFFGWEYAEAATALRLLSLGLLLNTFLGANSMTLVVMGKTRILLWVTLIGASLNVALNITLIPSLGITGAAAASLASFFVINLLFSTRLYQLSGIHPFTRSYLKPVITSSVIILVIYAIITTLFTVTLWMLPLLFILFLVVYGLSLILTRSFDNEDIKLLLNIEKRIGVDLTPIKNILRRFI